MWANEPIELLRRGACAAATGSGMPTHPPLKLTRATLSNGSWHVPVKAERACNPFGSSFVSNKDREPVTLIFCAARKMTGQATTDFLATADVLLIEHSAQYAELATRAIQDTCPETSIDIVATSEQALYYFFRAGAYATRDSTSPRLIVLNVGAPGIGSLEVLERIKRDRVGCSVPIVALALGVESDLVQLFCSRGASSFVAAPVDPHQYMGIMRQVANYWLNINLSPRKTN